jgi:hypothetical protein
MKQLLSATLLRRLRAGLFFVLLFAATAASTPPPAPTPEPEPPGSPAIEAYAEWPPRPRHDFTGLANEQPEEPALEAQYWLHNCEFYTPNPDMYTTTVAYRYYSGNYDIVSYQCYNIYNAAVLGSHPADDFFPEISRDAQKIAFVSLRTGNDDIFTMNADGSNVRQVTDYPGIDTHPTWSPDGSQIAFVSERSGDAEIYIMNYDGSGLRQVTFNPGIDMQPDWSPDGKKLAFIHVAKTMIGPHTVQGGFISIYDLGFGRITSQSPVYPFAENPKWSPDSSKIAFQLDANGDFWIDLGMIAFTGVGFSPFIIPAGYPNIDLSMGDWDPHGDSIYFDFLGYIEWNDQWVPSYSKMGRFKLESGSVDYYFGDLVFDPSVASRDLYPPNSGVYPLPEYSRSGNVTLNSWIINLGESELDRFVTYYRFRPESVWQTTDHNFFTIDQPGSTVEFATMSSDYAGNIEPIPPVPDTFTHLYRWLVDSFVSDARGYPIESVAVQIEPAAMNTAVTSRSGLARAYFAGSGEKEAYYEKSGYRKTENLYFNLQSDIAITGTLTGTNEILVNGQFCSTGFPLAGWIIPGSLPVFEMDGRTGQCGARFFFECDEFFCPSSDEIEAGQAILRQTVTIPPDLHKPTLSWYYRQVQNAPSGSSRFEITVTPAIGDMQTLFTSRASALEVWTHAWVDLSAWAGQEVTLDFTMYQEEGEGHLRVDLDEVSLAEWTTPVVTGLTPTHLTNLPNLGPCTITGENLMPGLQIIVNGQDATNITLDSVTGEVSFNLPSGLRPGIYPVTVVNPGGASALTPQPLTIGSFAYLPQVKTR